MNIKSYIQNLQFDNWKLYYRENIPKEIIVIDKGENSQLIDSLNGNVIENEILRLNKINSSFKFIFESDNVSIIKSIFNTGNNFSFPNRKYSFYNCAIVFMNQGSIIDCLNIDLKGKLCRNLANFPVELSMNFVEKITSILKENEVNPFKNYLPPSLAVMEHWMNYKFPFDFFWNPVFEVFETTIHTGLFSINSSRAKLEIAPVNGEISLTQIERAKYVEENKITTKLMLLEKFWEEYVKWKDEYELPQLVSKDQLYRLIKLSSIRIENDEEPSVHLYFRTWDEEHGQLVKYIDKDLIKFE